LYHGRSARTFDPSVAAVIVPVAVATYLAAAIAAPRSLAVVAGQLALAAVAIGAAIVVARARRAAGHRDAPRIRDALGLRAAAPRFFVAALAIGATAWYLNMRLVAVLPISERQTRVLVELIDRPTLVAALAMFAGVPAICEELVFRGVFARALGRDLPLAGAVAISAAVFSAYHLSIVQALPTLTLGAALAVIAIRADSAVPTMLGHALNNALAIAVSRDELPAIDRWIGHHAIAALAGAAIACTAGLTLALWPETRRETLRST
jgi:sodium transport system permease protein